MATRPCGALTSQSPPVTVAAEYATGRKEGVIANVVWNSDGTGYPTAIYASKKPQKIVGALGVLY